MEPRSAAGTLPRCRVAARLGDVRIARAWDGLAHLPALERPDLVAELIMEMLDQAV